VPEVEEPIGHSEPKKRRVKKNTFRISSFSSSNQPIDAIEMGASYPEKGKRCARGKSGEEALVLSRSYPWHPSSLLS